MKDFWIPHYTTYLYLGVRSLEVPHDVVPNSHSNSSRENRIFFSRFLSGARNIKGAVRTFLYKHGPNDNERRTGENECHEYEDVLSGRRFVFLPPFFEPFEIFSTAIQRYVSVPEERQKL